MPASSVLSISMKAGTTPSESMSGTLAAFTASLQSDAAQRIWVTGIGRRESRMIAGIALKLIWWSRVDSPRERLKSASAQASWIPLCSCSQRLMTLCTPPWLMMGRWFSSAVNRLHSAAKPWRSVVVSFDSRRSVTRAGTTPSWTMAGLPIVRCESSCRAAAQSCVVLAMVGQRWQMLQSEMTPRSLMRRFMCWFSIARRMMADAM
mmetsp:Transcript_42014/g.111960  ORF Transcript_42014/g.111960 Transcript_42014/m.111960 type:complete len:206 (-) Transcript_42014:1646-2263(-)